MDERGEEEEELLFRQLVSQTAPHPNPERHELLWLRELALGTQEALGSVLLGVREEIRVHMHSVYVRYDVCTLWDGVTFQLAFTRVEKKTVLP